MTKLFYVPIESLPERYSESWYRNFPPVFGKYGYNVVIVGGEPLSDHVGVGTFLDINSTTHFKFNQLQKIALSFHNHLIKNGDVFFIADMEFWGLESIRLMAQMNNIKVKIFSFLHAASYTTEDAFAIAEPYQKYTELGWLMACDKVFVGSNYHKQAVIDRRIKPYAAAEDVKSLSDKLCVTGNPLFKEDYTIPGEPIRKKKKLIISNRFDYEKRPNLSLDFAVILKDRNPDLEIVVTTSRPKFKSNRQWLVDYAHILEKQGVIKIYEGLTKLEYHTHLAESKVMLSNSIEENFGFCIAEALVYNTYPLLKRGLSHSELVDNHSYLLFDNEDEIIEKVDWLLNQQATFDVSSYAEPYFDSLNRMCRIMGFND